MDIYISLRFHHVKKLQQELLIKYNKDIVTNCFDIDVDKFSYFEFIDYVKENRYNSTSCVV